MQIEKDDIIPLDDSMRKVVLNTTRELNEDGLRVLVVAVKEYEERPLTYSIIDETNLILAGFIGFLDPAEPTAKSAIDGLQKLGVNIKVLTGDNEIVTKKICHDVGIPINKVILGSEFESMSDQEIIEQVPMTCSILVKLSPFQKSRIVKLLQLKGHTVGFMGDGINDAAAIRDSDVGISVTLQSILLKKVQISFCLKKI